MIVVADIVGVVSYAISVCIPCNVLAPKVSFQTIVPDILERVDEVSLPIVVNNIVVKKGVEVRVEKPDSEKRVAERILFNPIAVGLVER
jgi:hypothetical protein